MLRRGANPKQVPVMKKAEVAYEAIFALFLCRCIKDLHRDHHEGAKTSAMTAAAAKRRAKASAVTAAKRP